MTSDTTERNTLVVPPSTAAHTASSAATSATTSAVTSAWPSTRRGLLRGGLAALLPTGSAALLAGCGGGSEDAAAAPSADAALGSRFALAVLPDTQFYSRYATSAENTQFSRKFGSEPFMAQTSWAAANARELNIPFLVHLGDVVDQVSKPDQWKVADQAMRVLEAAKLPYSILAGNHDVLDDRDYVDASSQASGTDAQRTLAKEPYLQWFGTSRAKQQPTFGGRDPSGFHEYHVFTAEQQQFMVLSLSWRVSDDGIAWARKVISDHKTLPVILVNHQLLNIATDAVSPMETPYGQMLWARLIRDNDQIFMTLNGHHHGAARLTKTNDFGNVVEEMVVDYQMAYQGGNGQMRLYEFDLTHNTIDVLSFSPWVVQKPRDTLTQFDQAVLPGANEGFRISMDFKRRFARFNPGFKAGAAERKPIIEQARKTLLAGYTEPVAPVQKEPTGPNDYVKVASTVAHWRFFGGVAGQPVPVGYVVADETGANPVRREALNIDGVKGATLGDLVWAADRHRLSAAPGSVRFLNTNKDTPRMSYFVTEKTAALNQQTFTNGFTVEAFLKIDRDWSRALHAWMNLLTRAGQRGTVAGFSGDDPEATPVLFAISSLKEVQWEIVPAHAGTRSPQASWSGEILVDRWVHVAIVGNPAKGETTMYVEGAPVLRNSGDASGIATAGATMQWMVGAGSWDGQRADGFFGQLGEIRLAAAPLPSTQWLTARPS
ncbi:MAG: modulator protein [Acidovorax sp.]|nr:MAG: modulator protein [Acidovorax sp.]